MFYMNILLINNLFKYWRNILYYQKRKLSLNPKSLYRLQFELHTSFSNINIFTFNEHKILMFLIFLRIKKNLQSKNTIKSFTDKKNPCSS